jgi:hypothetical protein
MSIYAGHPESSFMLVSALSVFILVMLIRNLIDARSWRPVLRSIVDLVVAGAAGGALAAPLILPGLQLIELSDRRGNTTLPPLPPHALAYYLFNGFDGLGIGTGT